MPPTAWATADHSPFGVAGDVDAAAEGDGAGGHGLGEAGLALADDAGEEGVGVGDDAVLVEDPGVVAEPAAGPGVLSDVDALAAQAGFGEEGVGAGDGVGGGSVGREAEAPVGVSGCGAGFPVGGQVCGSVGGRRARFPLLAVGWTSEGS